MKFGSAGRRDSRLASPRYTIADEHQQRADHRVDEELEARVDAPFAAPDADDEVHRDEHHFPHHVEQEEIERQEHAEHAGREDEQQRVVAVACASRMLVQLPPTASSMMNVVSSTIITAMPSMPIVKRMPHDGIHAQVDNATATPRCAGSKLHQSPSETTNSTAKVDEREHARHRRRAADATSSSPLDGAGRSLTAP